MSKNNLSLSVFFTALSILIFEISLIRFLSVILYSNVAFLGISVALFGVAIGGLIVYLSLDRDIDEWVIKKILAMTSFVYSISIVLFLILSLQINPNNSLLIQFLVFVLAAIPFTLGNIFLSLVFRTYSQKIKQLYFLDLLAAGLGVALAVLIMNIISTINILILAAIVGILPVLFLQKKKSRFSLSAWLIMLILFIFIGINQINPVLDIKYSKDSREVLNDSIWNSFSRISLTEPQGILIDGSAYTPIAKFDSDILNNEMLGGDLADIAFAVAEPGEVLVIGPGGGKDVLSALSYNHRVTGAEINPIIVNDIMRDRYRERSGELYFHPDVNIFIAEGRSFISQSQDSYNVINIPLVDTWASTAAGNLMLVESNLYTVEAFEQYLSHLTEDGILTLTRWEQDGARLISLYMEAAKSLGISDLEKNIAVVNQVDENNLVLNNYLFKVNPFTSKELEAIQEYSHQNDYSVFYLPGKEIDTYYYDFINDPDQFVENNKTKTLYPVFDDNPFYFFQTPINFKSFAVGSNIDGGLSSLLLMLFVMTLLCIILPLLVFDKNIGRIKDKRSVYYLAYFGSLGLGFIFIEMSLIQKFVLYLEKPIYSYSVVLAALLLFAGLGSLSSKKLDSQKINSYLQVVISIFIVGFIYAFSLKYLINSTISLDIIWKILISGIITALPAFFMGMMLPLGFHRLGQNNMGYIIPWCWAVNGAFSVLATIIAIYLAIIFGFSVVLLIGAIVYLVALVFIYLADGGVS